MQKIIEENRERLNTLYSFYDPLTGEGSPLERFPFPMTQKETVYLPMAMEAEPIVQASLKVGSLAELFALAHDNKSHAQENMPAFIRLRIQYDFEFWGALCAKIRDKLARVIPFVLNYPQRKFLLVLEGMRLSGVPIRVVLLKARQWGGSTLLRLYMGWIQIFLKAGWGSAICTTVENQALHIRGMFDTVADYHPKQVFDIHLKPYRQSSKNREIDGRNCVVGIGSYEEPDNLRAFTFQMLHLSECAFWPATINKSPEGLMQNLRSTIPREEYTLIALESTANGVGNFFHGEWIKSERGESGYKPVFIPFFEIEEYQILIEDKNYSQFIETMNEKEWDLWRLGATLESILWHRTFQKEENYSDEAMSEEYPESPSAAFVSTGRRIFPHKYTQRLRITCMEPEERGELRGDEATGPGSLQNLEFHPQPGGNLWVWTKPDHTIDMEHRYVVFVDIGGRHHKSNKSVVRVLDRYWMMENEKPEFVCTWRGNIDQDKLAWIATQAAQWYCNALLVVEDNSLDRQDDGGGHFYTILDEIAEHYENLYSRTDPDKIKQGAPIRYGFVTNRKTKTMIIDALYAAAREGDYVERDVRAVDEMDVFEEKDNGRMGAVDGMFDDMVITTAGCIWCGLKDMPAPYIVKQRHATPTKRIVGEASM